MVFLAMRLAWSFSAESVFDQSSFHPASKAMIDQKIRWVLPLLSRNGCRMLKLS